MAAKLKAFTAAMKKKLVQKAAALGVAAPEVAKGNGKIYEAWALFEIASRMPSTITVTARDHTGAPTTTFRVRGGPGYIPAVSAPPDQPCHFHLEGPKDIAELHSSLRHRGASGDTHELDISAMSHALAEFIRHDMDGGAVLDLQPGMDTFLGVELKEYDAASALPKGYPRALLGVATELDHWGWVYFGPGRKIEAHKPKPIDFFLLTTTDLGTSQALTDYWDLNGRSDVRPGNEAALDEVATKLAARIS